MTKLGTQGVDGSRGLYSFVQGVTFLCWWISLDKLSNELLESITQITAAHAIGKDDPFFKILISVCSLNPQMLDLLRSYFESASNNASAEAHE